MTRVLAIARNTVREALRDRILFLLVFFGAAAILGSRLLAVLAVGDRLKIIEDVGLAAISLFGVFIAILMGTGLVIKEIERKTILTVLAKPVRRTEFLLGKFAGQAATLLLLTGLMAVIFLALVAVEAGRVDPRLLAAIGFTVLELLVVTAAAVLFSSFSTPILSALFALSFFLIGRLSWSLGAYIRKASGAGRLLLRLLAFLLPDLQNFNLRTEAVHGLPIPAVLVVPAILYAVVYSAFLLAVAALVFRRRDFS